MDESEASTRLDALRQALAETYGVTGSLEAQVAQLKRVLPRYERRQAQALVRVEQALGRGQGEIEARAFEHAELALVMYLEAADERDARKGSAVDVTMSVLVNVVLGLLALALLWWVVAG